MVGGKMYKKAIFISFLFLACGPETGPQGVATSPLCSNDCGPAVVFQPTDTSDIKIPFPNDMLCRFDPDATTQCRLNLGTNKATRNETRSMWHLDEMDGFSTYAPIIVSFDGPIDPTTVTPNTVLVVNIDPKSPNFGKKVALDLGRGDFPVKMKDPYPLFAGDPYTTDISLIMPDDNTYDMNGDGYQDFVDFYHKASHTLMLRPRVPLDIGTRYAVVITTGVKGFSQSGMKKPVRSPLPWVNVPSQTPFLEQGMPAIGQYCAGPDNIAFAWTFITNTTQDQIEAVRNGFYGKGPFAWMKNRATKGFADLHDTSIPFDGDGTRKEYPKVAKDNLYILQGQFIDGLIGVIAAFMPDAKNYKFNNIDYFVFGDLHSLNFRDTPDRVWQINDKTGFANVKDYKIPFMITIPKATPNHKPPFKVVLYAHGNQTSRFELLLFSNYIARQGLAAIVVDEIGHGPLIQGVRGALRELGSDPGTQDLVLKALAGLLLPGGADEIKDMTMDEKVARMEQVGLLKEFVEYGRAKDLNQDGKLENGEGFFVSNPFEQRDIFRQMMVDYFVMARLIKSLDPAKVPPAFKGDPQKAAYEKLLPYFKAGDFNTDGVLDLGGPANPLYMAGVSLGGIMTTLVTSYEPQIRAATPFVAGGGLSELLMRSHLRSRLEQGLYYAIGPVLSTCRANGRLYFSFNNALGFSVQKDGTVQCKGDLSGAVYSVVDVGYKSMSAQNMDNGNHGFTLFSDDETAWLALGSDKGDTWEVNLTTIDGEAVKFIVQAPVDGMASPRDSHKFISNFALTQMILDPADPINAVSRLVRKPISSEGPVNFLQMAVISDFTVPVSTQVGLARAIGTFGLEQKDWEYWDNQFIDHGIVAGEDHNVDDMEGFGDGFGPVPPLRTANGMCAVRFANVHGFHEYMASPKPNGPDFDWATFALNQAALFLGSGGTKVVDDTCIEKNDCKLLDQYR